MDKNKSEKILKAMISDEVYALKYLHDIKQETNET